LRFEGGQAARPLDDRFGTDQLIAPAGLQAPLADHIRVSGRQALLQVFERFPRLRELLGHRRA